MGDRWNALFDGLIDVLDKMEEVVEEIDDEIERLVGERESTEAEESQEPVDREMLVPVIESLPESERKILLEEFSLSLASDQRLELAERIVEGLSPDQRDIFIEAVLGAVDVDTQKHIKERLASDGKKAAVIAALLWFLDKVAEVFIQMPVESAARESWDWLRRVASKLFHPLVPEMVPIPAGKFWMGSDRQRLERTGLEWKDWMERETLYHQVYLPKYEISKYPVTNAQYAAFARATDHRVPKHWEDSRVPGGLEDHPVVQVSWNDAMAYCRWLSKVTGGSFTLPSEAEWEKAARGPDGRIYPWGDRLPATDLCNFGSNVGGTTPVGKYSPQGDSLYGCVDMAGNVWEWMRSLWRTEWKEPGFGYPYDPQDGRENLEASARRVVRGGSFSSGQGGVRCACRYGVPDLRSGYCGFRVVAAPFSRTSDLR
jgi:formylglycine-generating enzyme required for sulfatase activity